MIEEEFRKIEATQIIHHFYCDKCGEEVGASIEYEDGYVPIPPFAHDDCNTIKVRMGNYYMIYETNYDILCNACYEEVINEIDSFFEKLSPPPNE